MNIATGTSAKLLAVATITLLATACMMTPMPPEGVVNVRNELTRLQADPELASRAPVAIREAELAVVAAEQPQRDKELSRHLVLMADRKVNTAMALAQTRLTEDQRVQLQAQRESVRLDARTSEANQARSDATSARAEAGIERYRADMARMDTHTAQSVSVELQRQLATLNARQTERGLVVTLGDVLFETGKSTLKGGSKSNLGKLATFLVAYPDRTALIEGHTDSVGSDSHNVTLSKQRADTVQSWLTQHGVDGTRLTASGMGESSPVADNATATGRQQNRRVEVIISNNTISGAQ